MGFGKKWKKVAKYGNPTDIQAWNRMNYDEKQEDFANKLDAASAQRMRVSSMLDDYAQRRRGLYKSIIAPMEDRLVDETTADFNPNNEQIDASAASDSAKTTGLMRGMTERNLARYGQTATPGFERSMKLSNALATADNANDTRELIKTRGLQRAAITARLGKGLETSGLTGILAGGNSLSDLLQSEALDRGAYLTDRMATDKAGSQAIASFFADGGSVQLQSGDFIIPADVVEELGPEFLEALKSAGVEQ